MATRSFIATYDPKKKIEIIVVSDCIDEDTDQVCRIHLSPHDTYIRRSGQAGPAISRNLALDIAKGKVILFLDDDDAWQDNFIEMLNNIENIEKKMKEFGFDTYNIDGHDLSALENCFNEIKSIHKKNIASKPFFVVANTLCGRGVS